MRPLGEVQKGVLDMLIKQKGWRKHCGWHWGSVGNTERVLESLVRRGLAQKKLVEGPFGTLYHYTAISQKGVRPNPEVPT